MQSPNRSQLSSVHLDMARGLSAAVVVIGHLRPLLFVDLAQVDHVNRIVQILYFMTGFGHQAVMVFFVLSGFFVTSHIQRSMESGSWGFGKYFIARWTRLAVALVPALGAGLVFDLLGSKLFASAQVYVSAEGFGHIVSPNAVGTLTPLVVAGNLLFLQTILVPPLGTNGPLWSLANEFWYYILFPLLLLGYSAKGGKPVTRVAMLGIAVAVFFLIGAEKSMYFAVWLLGAFLAWVPPCKVNAARLLAWFFGLALVAALVVSRMSKTVPLAVADSAIALAFTGFVYGVLNADLRAITFGWYQRVATNLSAVSYTLYLVHVPLIVFVSAAVLRGQRMQPGLAGYGFALGLVVLVAAYAAGMWWLAERRSNDVRKFFEARFLRPKAADAG